MNDTQKWAIGGGLGAAIIGGIVWRNGGTVLGPVGAVATVSGIVVATVGVLSAVGTPARRKKLTAGERTKSEKRCKGSSEVQTLIFPRDRFTVKQAWAWAKRNGFKQSSPDMKKNTIRLRQAPPSSFRRMRTTTLDSHRDVQAVVGWRSC